MKQFAKNLKNARAGKKMSQRRLADACGVAPSTISSWENGTREPDIKSIRTLADTLGISVAYLFGDESWERANATPKGGKWFDIWMDDKEAVINTMMKNMGADIAAGYNYSGRCIREQQDQIASYNADYEAQVMKFASMTDVQVERWCYYDLLRRGVITR